LILLSTWIDPRFVRLIPCTISSFDMVRDALEVVGIGALVLVAVLASWRTKPKTAEPP
jgi:hypothetical protein